jgi:hypothetical protein
MPDPGLESAFLATDYRVDAGPDGPFVLRIGDPSPDADRLLARHARSEWAFVTACNPESELLTHSENEHRTAELEAVCLFRGWTFYAGMGVGRDGLWPPEPSFLMVGVSESEAIEVARHFGQHAIVAGRTGEPARLVWVA